jgi:tRNA-2-methylthio-N6-dimethylallyladenosine synthase
MHNDVPDEVKVRRLNEIIEVQHRISQENNQKLIGRTLEVLIEGESKKSCDDWTGRTDTNKVVVFPRVSGEVGDFVQVKILSTTSATLFGEIGSKQGKTALFGQTERSGELVSVSEGENSRSNRS